MWLGIPAGWLWVFSQTGRDYFHVYLETLAVTPATMAAWGWCLHRLSRAYPVTGTRFDPLEVAMTMSVILAVVALVVWVVFLGAENPLPAQGAW